MKNKIELVRIARSNFMEDGLQFAVYWFRRDSRKMAQRWYSEVSASSFMRLLRVLSNMTHETSNSENDNSFYDFYTGA